jgi:hypothetical protein
MQEYCKQQGVDLPPRTLMLFENVVTTPKQDRDGDILRTEGAVVDQSMPLLWHHMLPMPVGKMIKVLKHTSKMLKVSTAVIESQLGLDVAALIEFGALRISHGFLPYKYEPIERKSNGDGPMPGYDIKSLEILEESVVTVPSNTDAVITAYSRGKLCSPVAKHWAKHYFDGRSKTFHGIDLSGTNSETESNAASSDIPGGDKETQSVDAKSSSEQTLVVDTSADAKTEKAVVVKQGRVLSKANENRIREATTRTKQAADLLEETLKQVEREDTGEAESEKTPTLHESVLEVLWRIADATEEDKPMLEILREKLADRVNALEKSRLTRQISRIFGTGRQSR